MSLRDRFATILSNVTEGKIVFSNSLDSMIGYLMKYYNSQLLNKLDISSKPSIEDKENIVDDITSIYKLGVKRSENSSDSNLTYEEGIIR